MKYCVEAQWPSSYNDDYTGDRARAKVILDALSQFPNVEPSAAHSLVEHWYRADNGSKLVVRTGFHYCFFMETEEEAKAFAAAIGQPNYWFETEDSRPPKKNKQFRIVFDRNNGPGSYDAFLKQQIKLYNNAVDDFWESKNNE